MTSRTKKPSPFLGFWAAIVSCDYRYLLLFEVAMGWKQWLTLAVPSRIAADHLWAGAGKECKKICQPPYKPFLSIQHIAKHLTGPNTLLTNTLPIPLMSVELLTTELQRSAIQIKYEKFSSYGFVWKQAMPKYVKTNIMYHPVPRFESHQYLPLQLNGLDILTGFYWYPCSWWLRASIKEQKQTQSNTIHAYWNFCSNSNQSVACPKETNVRVGFSMSIDSFVLINLNWWFLIQTNWWPK